ncbi:putative membrane protein [Ruminiclostridium sufflavum DSM 19573]|uniref:Putative membrane protein n=1 Tax=Ruminiclostridium sufflavum DSM 19573 TaxID=1121337 RepID=A0A318XMG9_9FIRM|nr:YibE/F family protein [Ruminiclostridium sufflavum]PYG89052.1 putative membrane protein [Ruminiclostridium sufflavum DSM 19573]
MINQIKSVLNKNLLIYLTTIIISIVLLVTGNKITTKNINILSGTEGILAEKAQVIKIVKIKSVNYNLGGDSLEEGKDVVFTAKILSGSQKDTEVTAVQSTDPFTGVPLKEVKAGDKVVLYRLENQGSEYEYVLGEYLRTNSLMVLGIIFFALLILFGRFKGFNTILSLVFTGIAIFCVFIPAVLQGFNIYFWSIITCIFIIIMSLLIIYGANKKSLSAGIGCTAGILISGVLTLIMNKILYLTGLVSEESLYIIRMNPQHPIDLKAIIFAAIIIGAVGAIMDMAMSLSASLAELHEKLEYSPFSLLVKSGMSIGRDMMGTMTNTLILAYIGSSLSAVLLLVSYNSSLLELLNKEMIVVEVLQALVGSIGILFTIPLTSLICGYLFSERIKPDKKNSALASEEYNDGWD